MNLRPATHGDRAALGELLRACALPDDIDEQFPVAYVVAREGDAIVGCAGLEVHGRSGLLRSVAVRASRQGAGIGRALVEERLTSARGLERVYLLTTTTADWFRKLGFVDTARADAPPAIRASSQFAGGCCASAACLSRGPRADERRLET